jgi:6-phosphogluconolactonase
MNDINFYGCSEIKIVKKKLQLFLSLYFTVFLLTVATLPMSVSAQEMCVYFGTHSSGPGIGFSMSHFNTETGVLTKPEFLIEAKEPAYFIIHPDGKHLYTCNSGLPGTISAYEIDPATRHLTFINQKPSGGGDPSYISLDKTGRFALAANYDGGNICIYAIEPDGSLGAQTAFVQHTGKSINPERQTHAYAHSIIVDPSNRFVLVADLGLDKVLVYRFNEKDGTLSPNDPPFASVEPGSGARHVKFHPNGKWTYVIKEMGSTVTCFNWDGVRGALSEFQNISTLPEDFTGTNACAEMLIHPNGKFLYCSNRGHNSLAVFAIDQTTGRLSPIQHISTSGNTPRNFEFDPAGKWIICTNHGSNNAVVFRVNNDAGFLTQAGEPVEVPAPFCERFLPASK